jgi:hypothetical protein
VAVRLRANSRYAILRDQLRKLEGIGGILARSRGPLLRFDFSSTELLNENIPRE